MGLAFEGLGQMVRSIGISVGFHQERPGGPATKRARRLLPVLHVVTKQRLAMIRRGAQIGHGRKVLMRHGLRIREHRAVVLCDA